VLQLTYISIHPSFIASYFGFGVFRAATAKSLASVSNIDLRDYAVDDRGSVDDRPFGGGESMVLRPEPLTAAITALKNAGECQVILTSPKGRPWQHADALRFAKADKNLVFICGRFGGIDQRFIDRFVDDEFAVGEFVVSGGELPALMMGDAILRQIPGVLGNEASAVLDSFAEGLGGKMEYPLYTRPEVFLGERVPEVLLSGDHKRIAAWREAQLQDPPSRRQT